MSFPEALVIEEALRRKYPDLDVHVQLTHYRNRLKASFRIRDRRYVALSPETTHPRALSNAEWIHRFAAEISAKL